jgi:diguanylate cyclase (GGDEF)-like protein
MADPGSPPVLQFTLRVLEALEPEALVRAAAEGMVELFGVAAACVERASAPSFVVGEPGPSCVSLDFQIAPPGVERIRLRILVEPCEDLAVLRQQLLDLVAVVRRALAHVTLLDEERRRAREDALTGLDNRRGVEEWLDGRLQHAAVLEQPIAVLLVDLDHFKRVNDRHGHAAGDEVLRLAADCFRRHLRRGDRVCRWGGDEFLVVLPGMDCAAAVAVADRLRVAFAQEPGARGATMTIGIVDTVALAGIPMSVGAAVAEADACLYRAKAAGRNCCVAAPAARRVA